MDAERAQVLALLRASLADRYSVERELDEGGMAYVYVARSLADHRSVAVKVLKPGIAAGLGAMRFLREIEIASRLRHPHLLPLIESGEASGLPYFIMPFIDGETLRSRLRREKQLPLADAVRIACDVADALDCAHRHGFLHRDVKPENILLSGDAAIVADFGIGRAVIASAMDPRTTSGTIVGTPLYMSPEHGLGERDLDGRSDLYSLGCVFYEMLVGEPPFTGRDVRTIVARHAGERIPSILVARPDLPPEVEDVVARAMAKAPVARFPSGAAMADAMRATLVHRAHAQRRRRTRRAALVAAGVLGTAAVAWGASMVWAPPLREHDWLLVADFEGPADDPRLAPALRDLVTTALAQSRFVRVVDRRQLNEVMRLAGVPETTHVRADLARQLAVRSSVRAVLLGSIQPIGGDYSVVLQVVRADDGDELASSAGTASGSSWPETLVPAADVRVRDLRQKLGEHRDAIAANRPLRQVTTSSFDAFRRYFEAVDRVTMHGDFATSNRLLYEAIALDSGFASAWVMLGSNYLTTRHLDSARWAYARALALPDRLSPAETFRLQGDIAYALDHDLAAAVRFYDLHLAEAPHSRSGRSNRALYRSALGDYERALVDLEEAVALNPFGPGIMQPTLLNLGAVQVVLGRNAEARQTLRHLTGPFADYLLIMLATAEGRWIDADSVASAALVTAGQPPVFVINALTARAGAMAARGQIARADSLLAAAASESRGATARWYERARLSLAIGAGRPVPQRPQLLPRDTTLAADMLRALWAAVAGDTSAARAVLVRRRPLGAREAAVVGTAPALVEGWIAAQAGQWRRVTEALGEDARRGEQDPTILDRPDSYQLRWLVALAYERLGSLDSAAMALTRLLEPTRIPPGHYALRGLGYGFAHGRLAALHERRGDSAAAARHRDALLASFVEPDDIAAPLVLEARSAQRRSRPATSRGSTAAPPLAASRR